MVFPAGVKKVQYFSRVGVFEAGYVLCGWVCFRRVAELGKAVGCFKDFALSLEEDTSEWGRDGGGHEVGAG